MVDYTYRERYIFDSFLLTENRSSNRIFEVVIVPSPFDFDNGAFVDALIFDCLEELVL